jgi:membrane-associated PAP2 superfamily phosphatase
MKCENDCVGSFFFYLLSFSFSLLRIVFGVIPSSKVDQCLTEWIYNSGGYYFYLKFFSILFYIIFANFKVLDILLERFFHVLIVKGNHPNILEEVLLNI